MMESGVCDASSEGRPVALLSLNQRHGTSTLHPCHPPMTPIPPPSLQTSLPLPPCLLPARISQLPTFPLPSTAIHNRHTQAHEAKSTCAARPPNEPTSRLHSSLSKTPPSNLASFWGSLQIVSGTSDFRHHCPQILTRALHYQLSIEMTSVLPHLPLAPFA